MHPVQALPLASLLFLISSVVDFPRHSWFGDGSDIFFRSLESGKPSFLDNFSSSAGSVTGNVEVSEWIFSQEEYGVVEALANSMIHSRLAPSTPEMLQFVLDKMKVHAPGEERRLKLLTLSLLGYAQSGNWVMIKYLSQKFGLDIFKSPLQVSVENPSPTLLEHALSATLAHDNPQSLQIAHFLISQLGTVKLDEHILNAIESGSIAHVKLAYEKIHCSSGLPSEERIAKSFSHASLNRNLVEIAEYLIAEKKIVKSALYRLDLVGEIFRSADNLPAHAFDALDRFLPGLWDLLNHMPPLYRGGNGDIEALKLLMKYCTKFETFSEHTLKGALEFAAERGRVVVSRFLLDLLIAQRTRIRREIENRVEVPLDNDEQPNENMTDAEKEVWEDQMKVLREQREARRLERQKSFLIGVDLVIGPIWRAVAGGNINILQFYFDLLSNQNRGAIEMQVTIQTNSGKALTLSVFENWASKDDFELSIFRFISRNSSLYASEKPITSALQFLISEKKALRISKESYEEVMLKCRGTNVKIVVPCLFDLFASNGCSLSEAELRELQSKATGSSDAVQAAAIWLRERLRPLNLE